MSLNTTAPMITSSLFMERYPFLFYPNFIISILFLVLLQYLNAFIKQLPVLTSRMLFLPCELDLELLFLRENFLF